MFLFVHWKIIVCKINFIAMLIFLIIACNDKSNFKHIMKTWEILGIFVLNIQYNTHNYVNYVKNTIS